MAAPTRNFSRKPTSPMSEEGMDMEIDWSADRRKVNKVNARVRMAKRDNSPANLTEREDNHSGPRN